MKSVTIEIPESMLSLFSPSEDIAKSILSAAVVKWFELGRVSQAKASEVLCLNHAEFLELVASYQVSNWQVSKASE